MVATEKESHIPISEKFYSIQGEGKYAGHPALFLRLQGCNLCCGGWENKNVEKQEDMQPEGDATWVCDTIATWREAQESPTVKELVKHWDETGVLDKFRSGAHLILTGGEPTLPARQHQLVDLLMELESWDADPFVEVETNGTIRPVEQLDARVDHYNISLKLENSGMSADKRLNGDAIPWYKSRWMAPDIADGAETGAMFKFVVSRDEDVDEIREIIDYYAIPDGMVSLMPAGANQEQLRQTYPIVAELCKENNWQFSPRLHVDCWNLATGV